MMRGGIWRSEIGFCAIVGAIAAIAGLLLGFFSILFGPIGSVLNQAAWIPFLPGGMLGGMIVRPGLDSSAGAVATGIFALLINTGLYGLAAFGIRRALRRPRRGSAG